jgi:hypothetical protein
MKSWMGSFVDIVQSGILPGKYTRELREAPETIEGLVADMERHQTKLNVFGLARRIHQALVATGIHHARTLELAYGSMHTSTRVSLALAADCSKAILSHKRCVDVARKRKQRGTHTMDRGPRQENEPTVRQWLLWLMTVAATGKSVSNRTLLEEILQEARKRLDGALAAYCEQRTT